MKTKLQSILIVLTFLVGVRFAFAQGTGFTYQGWLSDNGSPANGLFDLRFTLFDVASGGTARIDPVQTNGVAISNGLFTVLLDFGFNLGASPRWLEIEVSPGGGVVYSMLNPRQPLTATPQAHYAFQAGDVLNPISEFLIPSSIAHLTGSNAFTGPVHFEGQGRPARPPFTVGNSELISNLNADLLDGLSAESFWRIDGNSGTTAGAHYLGTSDAQPLELRANFQVGLRLEPGVTDANLVAPGNLSFGTQTRQMLNLWDVDYGIGVQADTVYFRTSPGDLFGTPRGNFAWFAGGQHSDTTFDPGFPLRLFETSKELMRLEGNGQLTVFGYTANGVWGKSTLGNGVQGNCGGSAASGVYGQNDAGGFGVAGRTTGGGSAIYGDNTDVTGWAGNFNGRVFVVGNQHFGTQTRQMLNLWGTQYGIGVQANNLYFRCDSSSINSGFRWYKGGVHSDASADPGAGGTNLMTLNALGLFVNGSFVSGSDRNTKENIRAIDGRAVLDKVASLPVSEWNYKHDPSSRHVGPMAQDFRAAFGLGYDDKGIATVDADGVALAAIQGLNQKLDEKGTRIAVLEKELSDLKRLVLKLSEKKD